MEQRAELGVTNSVLSQFSLLGKVRKVPIRRHSVACAGGRWNHRCKRERLVTRWPYGLVTRERRYYDPITQAQHASTLEKDV